MYIILYYYWSSVAWEVLKYNLEVSFMKFNYTTTYYWSVESHRHYDDTHISLTNNT